MSFDYVHNLAYQENAPLMNDRGLAEGRKRIYPNKAPEFSGFLDIGFGHKLTTEELHKKRVYGIDYSLGISLVEAEYILKKDVEKKKEITRRRVGGEAFDSMPPLAQEILTDYTFTGVRFPKFFKAMKSRDLGGALQEYKRYYRDRGGNKRPLVRRNSFIRALLSRLLESGYFNKEVHNG